MRENLPAGWLPATLGQVVDRPRPKSAPTEHPDLPFVGMDSIAPGSMSLLSVGRFGDMKSAGGMFEAGDVLYGRMRPYLNKVHRAQLRGACSAEFIVMPPSAGIDGDFLAYLLHQREFVNFASEHSSGDRPRVDFESLSSFSFGLPPKPEQQRIVSRIEELFSEIDEGQRALERVGRLVERYRQSVLKTAVAGDLTRAGSNTPGLPAGWCLRSLAELSDEKPCNGISVKGSDSPPGVAALRLDAITASGFDFMARRFIPISAEKAEKLAIREGDFFVSRANGSLQLVGRGVLASKPPCQTVFPDTMIRYRLGRSVALNRWVAMVWASGWVRRQIEVKAKTTAGIYKISQTDIAEITFPVPPTEDEMLRAVDAVAKQSAAWRELSQDALRRQREATALRQSILKAAFSGQLVPQDPCGEPAAALLARLAAQPATAPVAPKRRGRKVPA
jgi:type I restriction enzyme, S subunit